MVKRVLKVCLTAVLAVGSLALALVMLACLAAGSGSALRKGGTVRVEAEIMDRYDMRMNNTVSNALEGVLAIEKVYWLSDDDLIAPEPDPEKFGTAQDAASLGWLLEDAADLLDGQSTLFSTQTQVLPGSKIRYYLDETIFAVTWKEAIDGGVYTFSEVKIKHPSQLRRFLAGGEYGSEIQLKTTQMAESVNAVLASSGDFYGYRRHGVIVYDGTVQRVNAEMVDTCYINDQGDLLFSYAGELRDRASAQAFVDENGIRFSMAFGPVLIDHGEQVPVDGYFLGQIEDAYPRAALCQKGQLHYVIAVVNTEPGYYHTADLYSFSDRIAQLDVEMAYTLDGGQTAAIVMNDELVNSVLGGSQRNISDIFYFATAVPDGQQ